MNDLVEIPLNQNLRFVSFDIENMYSNVPTNNLINIVKFMCSKQNHDDRPAKELIKMTRIILKQNYFKFQNSFMFKKLDLQWVAPTSSILSEKYIYIYIYSTSNTQQYMKC